METIVETRRCIQCDEVRSLDRFAGTRKVCKNCTNAKLRAKRNPAKHGPKKVHNDKPKVVIDDRMTDLEKQRRMRAMEGMIV